MASSLRRHPYARPVLTLTLAFLLPGVASPLAAQAIVPVELVAVEGSPLTGSDGDPVTNLNAPFTAGTGAVGFTGSLDVAGATDNFVFFDDAIVWRNSDEMTFVLSGAEGTMGVSDAGNFVYSPSVDGDDSVWTGDGLLARENVQAPGFPEGTTSTFHSRPQMIPGGAAYWVSGFNETGGTGTEGRMLYVSPDALPGSIAVVLRSDDVIDGLAIERPTGVGFDYQISDNALHHIHELVMDTGDTSTDGAIYVDGSLVARESLPNGDGDNWDNFDVVSINDSGDYLFSGDTDGDTTTDEFIAYDGAIAVREGDSIAGVVLASGSTVQAGSLNNLGQAAHIWSAGGLEYLFLACDASDLAGSSQLVLAEGDELDFDGDGVGDGVLTDFNASGVVGPGLSLAEDGDIVVEIDYEDGLVELEATVRLALPSCGAGPELTVSGSCPGSATITFTGGSAGGTAGVLRGSGPGSDVLPGGPCAGVESGLSGLGLVTGAPLDGSGGFEVTRNLPQAACGLSLQVLDVETCELSNVATLP